MLRDAPSRGDLYRLSPIKDVVRRGTCQAQSLKVESLISVSLAFAFCVQPQIVIEPRLEHSKAAGLGSSMLVNYLAGAFLRLRPLNPRPGSFHLDCESQQQNNDD